MSLEPNQTRARGSTRASLAPADAGAGAPRSDALDARTAAVLTAPPTVRGAPGDRRRAAFSSGA